MASESTPLTGSNGSTNPIEKAQESIGNSVAKAQEFFGEKFTTVMSTEPVTKAQESVGKAQEWVGDKFTTVMANEHVQKASTIATSKVDTIKSSIQEGHFSVRIIAQLTGLALIISAVGGFLTSLFTLHLLGALLEVYTFILGCLMLVLETSVTESESIARVLPRLLANAQFLQGVYGRGLLYFVAGSLHLEQSSIIRSVIGGVVMLVGIAYIFLGYQASSKMKTKTVDAEELQTKFQAAASTNGKLTVDEFFSLTESLELNMGRHESEVAFSVIDSDHDGLLTFEEFTTWWNDKQRDIIGVSLLV